MLFICEWWSRGIYLLREIENSYSRGKKGECIVLNDGKFENEKIIKIVLLSWICLRLYGNLMIVFNKKINFKGMFMNIWILNNIELYN